MKAVVLVALTLGLAALLSASASAPAVKVRVESGVVAGKSEGGVSVFRAIPYAAPPVGPLRWKPPEPAAAWSGERAADENAPACPQAPRLLNRPVGPTSEDCLYLNVFAPAGARQAPVMVWIHGGANIAGSSAPYDGSAFARDGVVLVAINYRLGPLGFFAHPALTREAGAGQPLGSFALMDQIAALKWVRRNIAAFGGDPANVTVFGESAGAMNIVALLGVPSAKGLFDKAIMESNIGWGGASPLAVAESRGAALAQRAGLPAEASAEQLRALGPEAVLAAGAGAGGFGPIIDQRLVPEAANRAFAAGRAIDAPLIIGWNSYEAALIAARNPTPQQAQDYTDAVAGAPARWIAAREASGAPAWLYHFSYVRNRLRASSPGAAHAAEIPFVFNRLGLFGGLAPPSAEDLRMASLIHSCWVAFAKTGKPTCASGPAWPAYTPQGDQLMEFGVESGVRTAFRKSQLDGFEARLAGGAGPL